MKRFATLALGAVALAACQSDPVAPGALGTTSSMDTTPRATLSPRLPSFGRAPQPGDDIPNHYIVLLKSSTKSDKHTSDDVASIGSGVVRDVYTHAVNGFSADIPDAQAAKLANDPRVSAVMKDQVVAITGSGTETSAPWGLDRIDQTSLPLSTTYSYANDGSGVTVYVVDTGILFSHTDFGGRAVAGYDAVTAGGTAVDCNGHGTHVSGTVGGAKYGVAKGVSLVGVRVLDCTGSGSTSGVIAGLDYVLQQKQANPSRPMVATMSLGGSKYAPLDSAVQNLVNAGVTVTVAAGNSAVDACTQSPADAPAAITVGATDNTDHFASFSNYGTCVDISAPGVSITSDYYSSTTATATMSGTSMATPHVAGAAALYLSANPTATPAQVVAALTTYASANQIATVPAGTPNKLLYTGFLSGTTPPPPPPPNQPPTATITAPASGASFTQGAAITFTGTGTDPEDGTLSGASLVWTSSINGQIGTGTSFSTSSLSVGTHTITLTAKDSQGATSSTTRTITVSSAPTSGSYAITPANTTIHVGQTIQMSASGGPVPAGTMISWRSSNTAVATAVQYKGALTGVAAGKITLFATAQISGYPTTSTTVTVIP